MKFSLVFFLLFFLVFTPLVSSDVEIDGAAGGIVVITGNLTTLGQLADVSIPSPANAEVLTYNSTSSRWESQTALAGTDTNASTACSDGEALLGNGTCAVPLFSFVETDPHWSGNESNVAFTNVFETFAENVTFVKNVTIIGNLSGGSALRIVDGVNITGNANVSGNLSANFYSGAFSWSVGTNSTRWLIFNTTQLDYNETLLNQTIEILSSNDTSRWNLTAGTIHQVNLDYNVGIGTINSTEKLNVVGDVNVTSNFWVDFATFFIDATLNRIGLGTRTPQQVLNVVGDVNITSDLFVDEDTLFVNATDDFVGIGTATPTNALTIIGSLNQTQGNLTGNLIYGEMFNRTDTGVTISLTVVDQFENVTSLSIGDSNQVTVVSDALIAPTPGEYMVQYSMSATSAANSQYLLVIAVNDVIQNETATFRTITAGGNIGNLGSAGIVDLNTGDRVNLQVADINAPAQDIVYLAVNVNMVRVGE
jgi:hypothetical protein